MYVLDDRKTRRSQAQYMSDTFCRLFDEREAAQQLAELKRRPTVVDDEGLTDVPLNDFDGDSGV